MPAAHPDVDLVGVSTTGGRTEWRAELARQFVDVDVVAGEHPDELVARMRSASPDAVLAIGPLTNIAALTVLGIPVTPLTIMGGAVGAGSAPRTPPTSRAEFRRIRPWRPWSASTDTTVVPLDVTVAMRLEPDALELLLGLFV